MTTRFLSPDHAAALIEDESTLAVDGSGGGVNEPDLVLAAIETRFLSGEGPHEITLIHPNGMGDGDGSGIDRLAYQGLVRRVVGGHWGWSARMQQLAVDEVIEAYCLPQGVMSHLMRETAGGRPGVITSVGMFTFADPRLQGGRLNEAAREDLVELITLADREWLFYKALPVDVALIRGSVADADGNLTMDDEGLFAETLSMAQAAKNSGGMVIAQVRETVPAGTLDPRTVKVPGVLVDVVVLAPNQRLSADTADDPGLVGAARSEAGFATMPFDERKIIARRAALELTRGDVVNLGFGMPDGVGSVLNEAGIADSVTFTVEQGHVGGVPAAGRDFGLARNQAAMVDAGYQFDWYDGGGIDVAVLSFAQVDREGNVNVGRFGSRIPGVGGFVNIAQGARRVVFVGTFNTGRLKLNLSDCGVRVVQEGSIPKFVDHVEQISFSGRAAAQIGKPVRYVTERAVFELATDGLHLVEVAPGIDVQRDVLDLLPFSVDRSTVKEMPVELFDPDATSITLEDTRGDT